MSENVSVASRDNRITFNPDQLPKLKHSYFQRVDTYLFHLSFVVFCQSLIVSGYFPSINTTLEKRFKLNSKQISFVYFCYEITCVPTTVVLGVIGAHINRPRTIGIAGLLVGIAIICSCLPHFLSGVYKLGACDVATNETNSLCQKYNPRYNPSDDSINIDCQLLAADKWALMILCFVFLIFGLGAGPIYVLGPTYLWDNLNVKTYSIFLSVFYILAGFGPPMGFVLGGIVLTFYIDVPLKPPCDIMTVKSIHWLGAWWIGFLIIGSLMMIISFPLLKFRAHSTQYKHIDIDSSISSAGVSAESIPSESKTTQIANYHFSFRESLREVINMLENTLWLLISMLTVTEQSVIFASVANISKYLQVIFNVSANNAGYLVGGLVVPSAVCGLVVGGYVIHRWHPSFIKTTKVLMMLSCIVSLIMLSMMFLTCSNNSFFTLVNGKALADVGIDSICNKECQCSTRMYKPLCDLKHQQTYFSPCHAGCVEELMPANSSQRYMAYHMCGCASSPTLYQGKCANTCINFYIVLTLIVIKIFLTALCQIPTNVMTLSIVSTDSSSMAWGLQMFFVHILAFIPIPLLFGVLFDINCKIWEKDVCNHGSVCRSYNSSTLPYTWFGAMFIYKMLGLFCLLGIYLVGRKNEKLFHSMKKPKEKNTNNRVADGNILKNN